MTNAVLQLKGLDCAACAGELEEKIMKISGVSRASVDFMSQKARVTCDGEALDSVRDVCSRFEEVEVISVVNGSKRYTLQLKGLDCAACAGDLEEEVKKIEGIEEASIDFMSQRAYLLCDRPSLEKAKYTISHFEDVKIVSEKSDEKKYVLILDGLNDEAAAAEIRTAVSKAEEAGDVRVDFEAKRLYVSCLPDDIGKIEAVCGSISGVSVLSREVEAKEHTLQLKGLDCDTCAQKLRSEIESLAGVERAEIDYATQTLVITCDDTGYARAVSRCNNFEDVKVVGDDRKGLYDRKIKIKNLCCANCGRLLEEQLNKIEGVDANVDFMNMRIILCAENRTAYDKAIATITGFENVRIVDSYGKQKSVWREHLTELIRIGAALLVLIAALILDYAVDGNAAKYTAIGFYVAAYIVAAYDVVWEMLKNISHGRIFDENFLMVVASVGAIVLGIVSGDGYFEGVVVMLLYQVGELFQAIAVGSSRKSISSLMDLKSEEATLLRADGSSISVNPEDLHVDDIILIKAGEKVPADGIIMKGSSSVDMKSLNGEPVPRDVNPGDEILSGGVNLSGVLEVKVTKEYKNCAVAKILDMVENATATKAQPEKFITKFARIYTPIVCLLAVIVAGLVPTIVCAVNSAFIWETYREWIYSALNFLLISCPCAMVISVPLSYFCGIGRCADFGILVKGSINIDEMATAKIAAFDKTGTLTKGTFTVTDYSSERALRLAAAAEKLSSHPIAAAFSEIEGEGGATDAEEIAGRGVKCVIGGKRLLCGNAKLLRENGVEFEEVRSVSTLIYVALDGEYVGVIYIDDSPKEGAAEAISALKRQGIEKCVMLTGDSSERAASIAETLGLDECRASLLPDEKLEIAEELKKEGKLLYVGDGINDAPVMATSDCAVSMGKVGSDAAIEASDIVLLTDDITVLPKARRISAGTRRIVFENIIGALAVKLAIMILALCINLPLTIGIIGDVGVMMLAVLNAMRIKISFKDREKKTK